MEMVAAAWLTLAILAPQIEILERHARCESPEGYSVAWLSGRVERDSFSERILSPLLKAMAVDDPAEVLQISLGPRDWEPGEPPSEDILDLEAKALRGEQLWSLPVPLAPGLGLFKFGSNLFYEASWGDQGPVWVVLQGRNVLDFSLAGLDVRLAGVTFRGGPPSPCRWCSYAFHFEIDRLGSASDDQIREVLRSLRLSLSDVPTRVELLLYERFLRRYYTHKVAAPNPSLHQIWRWAHEPAKEEPGREIEFNLYGIAEAWVTEPDGRHRVINVD